MRSLSKMWVKSKMKNKNMPEIVVEEMFVELRKQQKTTIKFQLNFLGMGYKCTGSEKLDHFVQTHKFISCHDKVAHYKQVICHAIIFKVSLTHSHVLCSVPVVYLIAKHQIGVIINRNNQFWSQCLCYGIDTYLV